jgi:hypothetical protein
MQLIIPLNLPKAELTLTKKENVVFVNCLIRKKKIILTPEEWVRQHYIYYLSKYLNYPTSLISIEKELDYFGLKKRWDIVVFNKKFEANILIECKSPSIKINNDAVKQVLSYQNKLNCEFIVLSNGIQHLSWKIDRIKKKIEEIDNIPICPSSE